MDGIRGFRKSTISPLHTLVGPRGHAHDAQLPVFGHFSDQGFRFGSSNFYGSYDFAHDGVPPLKLGSFKVILNFREHRPSVGEVDRID